MFGIAIDVCCIISAFFAYKLYSSLREKDRIKAEKKAAKQQRKEKENKTKVSF